MHQDIKYKAICHENRKCTRKQMKKKWVKTEVNLCDRTVINWLNEIGFIYRKDKGNHYKHTNRRK